MWGWGENGSGALCDGTKEKRPKPAQLAGISNAVDGSVSGSSVIVLADGTIRMCGPNIDGALGDGHGDSSSPRPRAPIGLGPVLAHDMSGNTSYKSEPTAR